VALHSVSLQNLRTTADKGNKPNLSDVHKLKYLSLEIENIGNAGTKLGDAI
jgi:hypothetical protein